MLRAKEKSVSLMMELVQRYSKPGDIVADFFVGTCTSAVACISLLDHRKFVGCDADSAAVSYGRIRVLNTFIANAARGRVPSAIQVNDDLYAKIRALYKQNKYGVAVAPATLTGSMMAASSSSEHTNLPRTLRLPQALLRYLATELQEPEFIQPHTASKCPDSFSSRITRSHFFLFLQEPHFMS